MLKKPDSFSNARRANLARQARSGVRSSGFEVPKTSNFGPRTSVVSPFPPVLRVSCRYLAGVLSCCATRADHRSSNVPTLFFRSLLLLLVFPHLISVSRPLFIVLAYQRRRKESSTHLSSFPRPLRASHSLHAASF